ncbi:MAG: NAD-dependent protein deacetylase [Firmicutes bacterium ADurb.Bin354]|nr:MAG: NAD-dependent protein deacetylase [Firmicutes bacterium ADurb.Bin354]
MMEDIAVLQKLIDESSNIVFFGGAGVSTESGIPDFRSVDGLYHQKFKYPPETMLSHSFYVSHKEEFYEFYREKLLLKVVGTAEEPKAEPNAAHKFLAELEKAGKLSAVVTQNIDGLHQAAGSKNVYELHGSVLRNYCQNCGKLYSAEDIFNSNSVPKCSCGGDIKPDVVLYEEGLDNDIMSGAVRAISNADMLIIGGTSLVVYPAAGLVDYYRGNKLVLINRDETARDSIADYAFHGKIGEIFSRLHV